MSNRSKLRMFGPIPKIQPGAVFEDRAALGRAGIHPPTVAGISGSAAEGADSIVLNGGYEDDEDRGNVIIYTGHGGQNSSGHQVQDQQMTRGNKALAVSRDERLPVRVSRGPRLGAPERDPRCL
jgi:putative restriction endonuclease